MILSKNNHSFVTFIFKYAVGGVNNLLRVFFDTETKGILCKLQDQLPLKWCAANITYGSNCQYQLGYFRIEAMDDSEAMGDSEIIISLELMDTITKYCFMVAAYNGKLTVIVEGTLSTLSGTYTL